ncbi:hypothetical protein [Pontibacter harenae]|uniref:hypothetical protein n=1 Tax=Pontibacter harenae TaxID=2894083 RepID=UPI001E3A3AD6|nr:hypothetical protein [Pontibacter harenae]MCC9168351.1 hypothetical protein [Pontibacter harenae]
MFKFFGGPVTGMSVGLAYWETALLTAAGMMTSVVIFSFIGRAASKWYSNYRRQKKMPVFGKKSRNIVKVWKSFGVVGVAFLTPLLLTPILGTVVAAVFGASKRTIFLHMLWSAILWSFVQTYLVYELRHLAVGLF